MGLVTQRGGDAMDKFIVGWESKITGAQGHYTLRLSKDEAQAWVDKMNKKYPDIEHWIEKTDAR